MTLVLAGSAVADPPWKHGDKLPGKGRGAAKHYPVMSTADICAFALPPLADDCWLWLWRLHTHQHEAFQVAEAWGFGTKPCSEIVWAKTTKAGGIRIGMGRSLRLSHEVCLLFKRGRPERASRSVPSVILAERTVHSEKPIEFYRTVDRFVGDVPKVELFARRQWSDWQCFGNEMKPLPCSCEDTDVDDPGPGHAAGCPWADPNYSDGEAAE